MIAHMKHVGLMYIHSVLSGQVLTVLLCVCVCRDEAHTADVTTRTFVTAAMSDWDVAHPYPGVTVRQSLGPAGEIESGTAAILAGESVRDQDFDIDVYACLPRVPWQISEADLAQRRDLRSWRIFSIDPITARDLDDALSIEKLPNGRWQVGVHIADVASFVKPGTPLDEEAGLRGTSV